MALVKFSQQDERRIKVTKTIPREAASFNCTVEHELVWSFGSTTEGDLGFKKNYFCIHYLKKGS